MDIRITNAVSVNRMWGELGDGELIAVFRYDGDALAFARMKADADQRPAEAYFIVSDSGSGKAWIVRPQKSDVAKAA